MRKVWALLNEGQFSWTGPDWLLHLLNTVDDSCRDNTLLMLWCAWHHRNDVMHGKGKALIRYSVEPLKSYAVSLWGSSTENQTGLSEKGKEKIYEGIQKMQACNSMSEQHKTQCRWSLPRSGWAKLNLDARFCRDSGQACCGVVVRDQSGAVMLSAWKYLENIASPEEAEALACLEGMRVAVDYMRQPLQVESDCMVLINALQSPYPDRASWLGTITEIKELSQLFPDCNFNHVRRTGNQAAHALAQLALRRKHGDVLRAGFPQEIAKIVRDDLVSCAISEPHCNNVF
jgi:ribonuclease HI